MTKFKKYPWNLPLFCLLALLIACSEPPEPTTLQADAPPTPAGPGDVPVARLGVDVEPLHYRLELTIDPRQAYFSGTTDIDLRFNEATGHIWLHGKNLEVSDVFLQDALGGRIPAQYEERDESGVALVTLAEPVQPGKIRLHFEYRAPFNTSTNALFRIDRGEDAYAATQFEAIAARQVFPSFDDPQFKTSFDISMVTQAEDVAITTTPEISAEELEGGMVRRTFLTTQPLPTYLIAFAVGPYDLVDYGMIPPNSIRDREIALRGLTARGLGGRMEYALENTAGILTELEKYFGTPYPYEKLDLIAVPESFGGAMENVGAITYDEWLMLMDENSPINQRRAYTGVHAHELAHQWFGNLVTPKWWNDIWLNEAFASWMDNKIAQAYWPEGEFDRETLKGALNAMTQDSLFAARQIREPVDHNNKIMSAFDGITYQKGGGVLDMLERFTGEEEFRAGVRLHMDRFADGTADAEDFIASVAEGSGQAEIEAAFMSFIEQPGVPLLSTEVVCEPGQPPRLEVSQTRYAPLGSAIDPGESEWRVPMCVSYSADGGDQATCAMLRESSQSIVLDAGECPTSVHPNADGAGYYRFALEPTWWEGLIAEAQSLPATEALALADSLDASFRAGVVPSETYVQGLAALAMHETWDVTDFVTEKLEDIRSVIKPEDLDAVHASFRSLVKPQYEALGDADDPASALLRQRLQRFLVVITEDPALREPLAVMAAARVGLDGDPDPAAAPEDQLETILTVGVQDLGQPFFDALLQEALASEDPTFRSSAMGALGRTDDPGLLDSLHTALLVEDFKGTEFSRILFRLMARPKSREATFDWLQANDVIVLEVIPEGFRSDRVPWLGYGFCTGPEADTWQGFVESHAELLPGYERSLAQAVEYINLCSALREARGSELAGAFKAASLLPGQVLENGSQAE
jgi:alanyl aminopeptidase